MNKKEQEFSTRYNAESIRMANRDTLLYWLDHKGKWLNDLLHEKDSDGECCSYDKFIHQMADEIETYQRWMYLKGMDTSFLFSKERKPAMNKLIKLLNGEDNKFLDALLIENNRIVGFKLEAIKEICKCFFETKQKEVSSLSSQP